MPSDPLHSSPSETGPRAPPEGAARPDRREADATRLVLVVDDDPDLLEVTRFALEGEGIEVETARDGEEALARLRAGSLPRLVLLDLMMPVMNGWEFLDEIAKVPALAAIPIVVLTAADPGEVPGAVEVLRKPFDLGALIEAVERHARGGDDDACA